MSLLYLDYVQPNELFYQPKTTAEMPSFNPTGLPEGWLVNQDSHWTYVTPSSVALPAQGWKVHVSTQYTAATAVLEVVATYCFSKNIAFKFTPTKQELILKNAKQANRVSGGKFITIYPQPHQLESLLHDLAQQLSQFPPGPYILSDMRYGKSSLYYRYGGFQPLKNSAGAYCIYNDAGELVEDKRVPYYHTPPWVTKPDFLLKNEQLAKATNEDSLHGYQVTEALHFSFGGGVYKATSPSGQQVVLKEGRPNAGIDQNGIDAFQRVKNEAAILKALAKIPYVPAFVDEFKGWEHYFCAMENVEGINLSSWLARNYPFGMGQAQKEQYVQKIAPLLSQLITAVQMLHQRGFCHGDLQPLNVIVTPAEERIILIDLETAIPVDSEEKLSLATPGFSGTMQDKPLVRDYIGLYKIVRTAFCPLGDLEQLGSAKFTELKNWIHHEFGDTASSLLAQVVAQAQSEGVPAADLHTSLVESVPITTASSEKLLAECVESLKKQINATNPALGYGDIDQYELALGTYCLAYGGAGYIKAALDFGFTIAGLDTKQWLLNAIAAFDKNTVVTLDMIALGTGLAGLIELAIRLDYQDILQLIVTRITKWIPILLDQHIPDISLHSGWSGVALALLSTKTAGHKQDYLPIAEQLFQTCEKFLATPHILQVHNQDNIPTGLMFGSLGASYLGFNIATATGNTSYYQRSRNILFNVVEGADITEHSLYLAAPDGRKMPYFSMGGAGIYLLEQYLNSEDQTLLQQQLAKVKHLASPCAFGGLYKGLAGLIGMTATYKASYNMNIHLPIDLIKLFLIKDKETGIIYTPGDQVMLMSSDIASGLAGWCYALTGRLSHIFLFN